MTYIVRLRQETGTKSPFLYGTSFGLDALDTAFAMDEKDADAKSASNGNDCHDGSDGRNSMVSDQIKNKTTFFVACD
jgi:hypothetical protein